MSVGPCYGGTAQLGVVGRMCRGPATSGARVDVEVVLACVPQAKWGRGVGRGDSTDTLRGSDSAGTLVPAGVSCVTVTPNGGVRASGDGLGLKLLERDTAWRCPQACMAQWELPHPTPCAAGCFGEQACISAGSSSTQHHFSCRRRTQRSQKGDAEEESGAAHSTHPMCPTLPHRCAMAALLPSADGV